MIDVYCVLFPQKLYISSQKRHMFTYLCDVPFDNNVWNDLSILYVIVQFSIRLPTIGVQLICFRMYMCSDIEALSQIVC